MASRSLHSVGCRARRRSNSSSSSSSPPSSSSSTSSSKKFKKKKTTKSSSYDGSSSVRRKSLAYYFNTEPNTPLPYETVSSVCTALALPDGVGVLPTDSSYAFVCDVDNLAALSRMYRLKRVRDPLKAMSVLCRNMTDVNYYSNGFPTTASTNWFRITQRILPGPYTFILHASKALPKQCLEFDTKCRVRRTVGVRVSNDAILNQIMQALERPLFCSSVPAQLEMDDEDEDEDGVGTLSTVTGVGIFEAYKHAIDFVLDDGVRQDVSTIVDLTNANAAELIRQGSGSISSFEEHIISS